MNRLFNFTAKVRGWFSRPMVLCLSAIAVYVYSASYCLHYPALHGDDALIMNYGLSIYHHPWQWLSGLVKNNYFTMFCAYHGAVDVFLFIPFLKICSDYFFLIRFVSIVLGSLALFFLFWFLHCTYGKKTAFLSGILLASMPAFVFSTTRATFFAAGGSMVLMAVLVLYVSSKWYVTRKLVYYYLSVFFLCFGLGIRLWFVWFVLAFIAAVLFSVPLFQLAAGFYRTKRFWFGYLLGGIVVAFVAAAPLIHDNLVFQSSIRFLLEHTAKPLSSVDNSDYAGNLCRAYQRFTYFFDCPVGLEGVRTIERLGIFGMPLLNFYLFLIYFLFYALVALVRRFRPRRDIFLLVLLAVMFLQTPFTVTWPVNHHLIFLLPFACIVLARGAVLLMEFRKSMIAVFIVSSSLVLIGVNNISVILKSNDMLCQTGGKYEFSKEATDELIFWLDSNAKLFNIMPVTHHSNLSAIVELFTHGAVSKDLLSVDSLKAESLRSSGDKRPLVVVLPWSALDIFSSFAESKGIVWEIIQRFKDKQGEDAMVALRIK